MSDPVPQRVPAFQSDFWINQINQSPLPLSATQLCSWSEENGKQIVLIWSNESWPVRMGNIGFYFPSFSENWESPSLAKEKAGFLTNWRRESKKARVREELKVEMESRVKNKSAVESLPPPSAPDCPQPSQPDPGAPAPWQRGFTVTGRARRSSPQTPRGSDLKPQVCVWGSAIPGHTWCSEAMSRWRTAQTTGKLFCLLWRRQQWSNGRLPSCCRSGASGYILYSFLGGQALIILLPFILTQTFLLNVLIKVQLLKPAALKGWSKDSLYEDFCLLTV